MSTNLKRLVYCAVSIALATATGALTLFELPNGGSITPCSMLFATLPGFFFGPVYGLVSGVAYGLSGFFSIMKNGLYIGYIVSCLGRFVFAFISGVAFFADYAPEGMNPAVYSVTYIIIYIAVEMFLTIVIIAVPAVRNAIYRVKKQANS